MEMKEKINNLKNMTIKQKIKINIKNLTMKKQMKLFTKNIKKKKNIKWKNPMSI